MFTVRRCLFAAFCFLALAVGGEVSASEIRLKNGQSYADATVLHRDATNIEFRVPYGIIRLPLSSVATVDGRRVAVAQEVTPSNPGTTSRASATPLPQSSVKPGNVVVQNPQTARAEEVSGAGWNWKWLLLFLTMFGGVWAATVFLVHRDLRRSETTSRFWLAVTATLPILGYFFYQTTRQALRRWEFWKSERKRNDFVLLDEEHEPIAIAAGEEISGIENAKDILQTALHQRASDVHIEPLPNECRVRYRIDGTLYARMKLSPESGIRLISALKSLAQIDITERRRAQDGRFAGRNGARTVDFRLASTPSVHGEKLVIRILDRNVGMRSLNDIGLPEHMMKDFVRVIHSSGGMILATGPTGSGKTSTLYAALSQLDTVRLNLVTIEDPVEYELAGATQIPVNNKVGVTFESGLKSILRQDPDVIFVGEMRDLEAAQIALRSALTGHLVFSSLHTRDSIGTISRLIEMGLERKLLSSALSLVLAQRLVRVLCRACRQPYACQGNELEDLGFELPEGETIYRPVGCRKCEGTGYVGRTACFEMLIFDEELRAALNGEADGDQFMKLARTKGFRTYREDAAQKVLLGVTSVEDVLKAN